MKIRQGFVSNSSSSSFVLLKGGLSDEVVDEFRSWVDKHNQVANIGYIEETKSVFSGQKDQHVIISNKLWNKIGSNVEYPEGY